MMTLRRAERRAEKHTVCLVNRMVRIAFFCDTDLIIIYALYYVKTD